jgi:MFS family permease
MSNLVVGGEWRQSWHLVALTVLGLTCAPTTLPVYTLGVFVAPYAAEFGWGRGEIQAAILFSTGLAVFFAPLAGTMVNRFGIRRTIVSGLVGLALSCLVAAANTGALWQLYAAYALMSALGAGAGAVGWVTLISGRFEQARGLALGIALSGTGLCAALMPMIATFGIDQFGWRGAYMLLAAFIAFVVLPICAALLPDEAIALPHSEERSAKQSGMVAGAAIRHWRFWVLGTSTAAIYLVIGGLIPNIVPALMDTGASAAAAASIMGLFGIAVVAGRICVGALVDRFWAPVIAALVLLPAAIGCLVLQSEGSLPMLTGAVVFIGIATGMELDVLGFLAARYFGLADYARVYGRLYVFVAATAGVAPMLFGYVYDWTGSYTLPLQVSAGLLITGAIGLMALGKYPDW